MTEVGSPPPTTVGAPAGPIGPGLDRNEADLDEADRARADRGRADQPGVDGLGNGTGRVRRLAGRFTRRAGTAARLAALYSVVLAAVIAGSVAALSHTTRVGLQSVAVGQLNAELDAFQAYLARPSTGSDLRQAATTYLRAHATTGGNLLEVAVPGRWSVSNAAGSALAATPAIAGRAETVPARTTISTVTAGGRSVEVMAAPIRQRVGPPGVLVATSDLTGLAPARSAAFRLAVAEGAVALLAGVVSAYLLLRRLLRRIGSITEAAERIGRDRLAERLGDQGTADEVGRLAASLDSMLDRIQVAVAAQEELLSDVSHQLRTPLTVARGHLEILQRSGDTDPDSVRETLQVAMAELDRMGRMVEQVLQLGLAREPMGAAAIEVDVRSFLADFARACTVIAERHWVLAPLPDARWYLDEEEVRGALLNLVDNSVCATGPDDTIEVSATLSQGSDGPATLRISVDDSGPGIAEDDRARVLQRTWRAGRSGGTGLGLAIVDAVCRAHGGSVEIGTSRLGGARVTMVLGRPEADRR